MAVVVFEPSGVRAEAQTGESIFEVAGRSRVVIQTSCVGRATCGLCRIKVVAGEDHLSPLNDDERKHLGNVYFITKERLSCQARVVGGDVTVLVPPLRPSKR